MFKRLSALVILATLIAATVTFCGTAAASDEIAVYYNNQKVAFPDQQPVLVDDRVLVPVRLIQYILKDTNDKVTWVPEREKVVISGDAGAAFNHAFSFSIELTVGSKDVAVKDFKGTRTDTLDVPPTMMGGRVMVPLRYLCQLINYNISWGWDGQEDCVLIFSSDFNGITGD